MEAQQGVELTGTNRSCGLTIISYVIAFERSSRPTGSRPGLVARADDASAIRDSELRRVSHRIFRFPAAITGGATPDPIPNSEVKPSRADGTAGETVWESRTPPELFLDPELSRARVGASPVDLSRTSLFYRLTPRYGGTHSESARATP